MLRRRPPGRSGSSRPASSALSAITDRLWPSRSCRSRAKRRRSSATASSRQLVARLAQLDVGADQPAERRRSACRCRAWWPRRDGRRRRPRRRAQRHAAEHGAHRRPRHVPRGGSAQAGGRAVRRTAATQVGRSASVSTVAIAPARRRAGASVARGRGRGRHGAARGRSPTNAAEPATTSATWAGRRVRPQVDDRESQPHQPEHDAPRPPPPRVPGRCRGAGCIGSRALMHRSGPPRQRAQEPHHEHRADQRSRPPATTGRRRRCPAPRWRSNAVCRPSASGLSGSALATSLSHPGASSSGKNTPEMNAIGMTRNACSGPAVSALGMKRTMPIPSAREAPRRARARAARPGSVPARRWTPRRRRRPPARARHRERVDEHASSRCARPCTPTTAAACPARA